MSRMDGWPRSRLDQMMVSIESEKAFDWKKWASDIPYIEFPPGWAIKVIPPIAGAIVRFWVKVPGCDETISVYLDCYNNLGCMPWPYWEVYPYHGDTGRCRMDDVVNLMMMIGDRDPGREGE